ncbi:sensor domain-containing diguanylate cyclase [Legionella jamestowniensis]|uniref:diguanylate cyclase n=1 Tax=Legionella jamestowniensis TaxID=455 RepID=A0A0W0UIW6_9GAMM|nr:sensor domain-containing diguanylate cyclase [Legionella jamestowniensis]KTD07655.1 regulatory protein (GGDEF, PAS, PAC domains) [Legionella jamestowniensis]OCH99398.1 diguanylate cyclase [Legionella jamestowniensis]SFL60165.1 PAS domain-containing protein [Legionella jamestowniensis DSM 19215]
MDFPGVSKSQIEERLISESYKKFHFIILADFLAVLLYTSLIWPHSTNSMMVISWVILMIVVNDVLRAVMIFYYHQEKKRPALRYPSFWKKYFILNNLQSGILWGMGGLLFIYVNDPLVRVVIFVYLTGLLGAPAAKLLTYHWAYLGFMTPIWLVMLVLSVSITDSLSVILFLAVILYVSLVIFSTAAANKSLLKSIYLELYSSNLLHDLKRSEENFRNTIENAPIGMAIVSPEGNCIHANQTLQDILGYNDHELNNKNILEITYRDDLAITKEFMTKILKGEMRISHLEKRFIRKDGSIIWAMVSLSLIRDDQGEPVNFILQMKDVSDRIENEEKMRQLNEKTLETLNELKLLEHDENLLNKLNRSLQICISAEEAYPRIRLVAQDLFPGLSGGLMIFNKAINQVETVLQWGEQQLLTKTSLPLDCFVLREADIISVDNPQKSIPCHHYLQPPPGGNIGLPLIVQNELIGVIHLFAPVGRRLTQHQKDMAVSFSNIVKLALANINLRSSLNELSLHDPLTGLYNRRYLNDLLSRELIRLAREKNTLCIAMLDLDNFKNFNDTYSHLAGDEVLRLLGQLLKSNFRDSDIAFRFGGEEFVVALLNTTLEPAAKKLDQFRELLKDTPVTYKNQQLAQVTISIGVAEAPKHGATIDDIIKAADQALYAAKQAGKDRVKIYKNNG